ncbi:hypothetical protein GW17_00038137 [Ensete ventricosum]|nr:hypothetical protein GW17_00038137 [Ensete ventricosum]RZR97380.1 hypothetical protein BHM03_00026552 [Ensete ventricosum]
MHHYFYYLAPVDLQKLNPPLMKGLDSLLILGTNERTSFGSVIVQRDMRFSGLTKFGTEFLSKFGCSQMPHLLLEHITFVDTPGVLSGEQQNQHGYDFTGVTSWFAAKCDLIVLLFDPHKIDISDEFNNVIKSLHGHEHASSSLFSPPPASCLTARCSSTRSLVGHLHSIIVQWTSPLV